MRVQEMELGSRKAVNDLEAQTLMRLSAIKQAIEGIGEDADGIAAVRTALRATFEKFIVRVDLETREGSIEAVAKPERTNVGGEELRPVLRKVPLDLSEESDEGVAAGLPIR
jgi:hypothetical protein